MSARGGAPRVVVDLNLFVSGLISKLGQPRRLIDHLRRGSFQLLISRQLREELAEVLQREKFVVRFGITGDERAAFLYVIDTLAVTVEPQSRLPVEVRDVKDEIVLATALGGGADYLVTGDADLLSLASDLRLGGLSIVTVRQFLDRLETDS